MSTVRPIVALTAGEPAGIGPDLLVMLAQHEAQSCLVAVTDPELLAQRARALDLSLRIDEFDGARHRPGRIQVEPVSLPVIKHAGFGEAVNVTLGLPVIRTSVDHGTALELAASGTIELGSLRAALRLAERMSRDRHTA